MLHPNQHPHIPQAYSYIPTYINHRHQINKDVHFNPPPPPPRNRPPSHRLPDRHPTPAAPICGTCNPLSGQNNCDVTTSCINTGTRFHCACRAGYKASPANTDVTKQFRLPFPNFQFLVFVPEFTQCNTLCDNPYGASPQLCAEVPVQSSCPV
ncbi:putative adhesin [Aspergillus aculeatinus CBS 121060]|uniref:Uncharacterized protein n=1 Tax=Aspergillus aculeatinus CBS 121060 TaxID=1448322 RepID=A0ACD1H1J9_9EURO|nr:hypothetical protein BO66DRAFT_430491 [Aspergillus aculeatinus CBS 121060]RAH67481.1 hypothetical protein BO66DRAFT_430491 [Aspergillus aculeatinus CBS 121060]